MPPHRPLKDRFHEKYVINSHSGCWTWIGAKIPQGYGYIRHEGKNIPAHRASYILAHDEIPGGMIVCHKCDNPSCVNPDHLFIGTHKENMKDMEVKGRSRKLSRQQIDEMLSALASGNTQNELAAKYKISRSTIQLIVSRAKNGDFGPENVNPKPGKYVRLTDRQIVEITCRLLKGDDTILSLASEYNVDRKTIRRIRGMII